jgi:hypothetical protein
VSTLTDEIDEGPVALPLLHVAQFQMNELGPSKAASQEHSENGAVGATASGRLTRDSYNVGERRKREPTTDISA